MNELSVETLISPSVPEVGTAAIPGGHPSVSSPLASTLILGSEEALLVDPPWHVDAVSTAIAWVRESQRHLSKIYITHGHGDHWFGVAALVDAFPDARVLATRGTWLYMHKYSKERMLLWDRRFPGQVSRGAVTVRTVTKDTIPFEQHRVEVLDLGHTDTDETSALWLPERKTIIAGDSVYNECHLALNEISLSGRTSWLRALDQLVALRPEVVIAGHKRPEADDHPGSIAATREYILAFEEIRESGSSAVQVFNEMIRRYPAYANPKALWRSISALGMN